MKMPRDRDREVKLEKNSRETRLSQVTARLLDRVVKIYEQCTSSDLKIEQSGTRQGLPKADKIGGKNLRQLGEHPKKITRLFVFLLHGALYWKRRPDFTDFFCRFKNDLTLVGHIVWQACKNRQTLVRSQRELKTHLNFSSVAVYVVFLNIGRE